MRAPALRLRPDHGQARPERRARRAGDDREAEHGRLHHALQAEPRRPERQRPAGGAGPPAPRDVAVRTFVRLGAVLRSGRREDRRAVPARLRHAGQGERQMALAVHGPLGRQPADVTYITYDIDFIPKAKGDAIGIKPVYPIWLDVRPAGYPV